MTVTMYAAAAAPSISDLCLLPVKEEGDSLCTYIRPPNSEGLQSEGMCPCAHFYHSSNPVLLLSC